MELDSNSVLPNHPAWQNIFNDWNTIVSNSSAFNFALPLNIPSKIRQCLYQAHAVGKSSLGTSTIINYSNIYPTAANDLQTEVINKAICFGQGLAPMASRPSVSNDIPKSSQLTTAFKPSEPEQFDGARSKFGNYVTKLQMQFRSNPIAFSSDESKILYAGSYLTGNAYTWVEPHVDQKTGEVNFSTFSDCLESLRAVFDDPDAYATSERQLDSLRQDVLVLHTMQKWYQSFTFSVGPNQKYKFTIFEKG